MRKPAIVIFLLMVSLGNFVHAPSAKEDAFPLDSAPATEIIQQGKTLYEGLARCVHCHGSIALRRPLTDQELFSVIKFGVPGTAHIPYKHLLTDEEILAIVQYQLHGACGDGCEH